MNNLPQNIYEDEQEKLDNLAEEELRIREEIAKVLDQYKWDLVPVLDSTGAPKVRLYKRL